MPWYRIAIRFERPPAQRDVDELAACLDYPEISERDANGKELVLTLEAEDASEATASVTAALAKFVETIGAAVQGEPLETSDPRVPSPLTTEILATATDMLLDQLRDDVGALRAGRPPASYLTSQPKNLPATPSLERPRA